MYDKASCLNFLCNAVSEQQRCYRSPCCSHAVLHNLTDANHALGNLLPKKKKKKQELNAQ